MLREEREEIGLAGCDHAPVVSPGDLDVLIGHLQRFHDLDPRPRQRYGHRSVHVAMHDDDGHLWNLAERIWIEAESSWRQDTNRGPLVRVLHRQVVGAG